MFDSIFGLSRSFNGMTWAENEIRTRERINAREKERRDRTRAERLRELQLKLEHRRLREGMQIVLSMSTIVVMGEMNTSLPLHGFFHLEEQTEDFRYVTHVPDCMVPPEWNGDENLFLTFNGNGAQFFVN